MRAAIALLALAAGVPPEAGGARVPHATRAEISLDGAPAAIRWTDGDSFRILTGPRAGERARLAGVNALETFGPVHRWGGADGKALLSLAKRSAARAAAASVRCALAPRRDAYRRLLAECPEVAAALVRSGDAMVFAVEGTPDPALLALQLEAQRARRGMWARGAPPLVPSSVHSADDPSSLPGSAGRRTSEADRGPRGVYDRIVDTRTGVAEARPHARVYATCEEVCVGEGKDRACMVHVPFARRYRDRPRCLRGR